MKTTKSGIPIIDHRVPGFIEYLEHALTDSSQVCNIDRPYNGQPWTDDGERGKTLVAGLTMRDIRDCLLMALVDSIPCPDLDNPQAFFAHRDHQGRCKDPACSRPWCKLERGEMEVDDVYQLDLSQMDPLALAQNLCCRIEKAIGIFPNVIESDISASDLIQEMQDAAGIKRDDDD